MDNFKDFTGKDLDDAIAEACAYFDTQREQLEVDIVQDAKSGIFGLVGARKAMIRARRMQLRMPVEKIINNDKKPAQAEKTSTKTSEEQKPSEQKTASKAVEQKVTEEKPAEQKTAEPKKAEQKTAPRQAAQKNEKTKAEKHTAKPTDNQKHNKDNKQDSMEQGFDGFGMDDDDTNPRTLFNELDKDKLKEVSNDVISQLIMPIVGMVPITVEFDETRVCIGLDCGDDSGLLIGREGQTLAALQYISSRIISRHMQAAVRVQLDAGDYRTRQDEKLRELVLYLAERVRTVGRAHSTRPLSSYHRRIVHMALQDCNDLVTRSSGEGPLKRVIIQRKRGQ